MTLLVLGGRGALRWRLAGPRRLGALGLEPVTLLVLGGRGALRWRLAGPRRQGAAVRVRKRG